MALMDNLPGWKVFSTGIGAAALLVVAWFAYAWFFRAPDDLKTLEREALEHALDQLSEHYRDQVRQRGEQRVVLMPVLGETSGGEIRTRAFDRLNAVAGLKAVKPPDPDLEERASGLFKQVLGGKQPDVDPNAVFERAAEADEVITLRVALKAGADSGRADLEVLRIVRADDEKRTASVGEALRFEGLSGAAREQLGEASTGPGFWSVASSVLWRGLVLLLALAVIPWLSWPVAHPVFRRDSNAANAGLLALLTLAGHGVLLALAGFEVSVALAIIAGLQLPVAGIYNLAVLNRIEESV